MDAQTKLKKARTQLILDHPFFGSLALKMPLVPAPGLGTFATNGSMIAYDPAFVDTLTVKEVQGIIAHEVMHPAMLHHVRQDEREDLDWNRAADYAINPHLIEAGLTLPEGGLIDARYSGKAAEEIYNQIHMTPDPNGQHQGPQGDGQDGAGNGQGNQDPNQNPNGQGTEPNNPPGQNPNDPGGCGQVMRAPKQEHTQQQNEWRVNLAQAAQAAQAQGKLPASIARMVEDTLNPKADWRELLRAFVERSARNDYNWTRPNTRHLQRGFYLPTLISDQLPPITVAVDTSGSIRPAQLAQFAAELSDMLTQYRTRATVVYCDAAIARIEEYETDDLPLKLNPAGFGGTDFRPVFEWQDKQDETPAALIYLTDLMGSFPEHAPEYPVLWATLENGSYNPPWGEHVQID